MFILHRLSGPNQDESLQLDAPVVRLGRSRNSDVAFDREKERVVSNQHCEIRLEQGVYVLYDLQSTHGTFVNGQKSMRTQLYEGDIIGLGQNIGGPTLRFSRRQSEATMASFARPDDFELTAFKGSSDGSSEGGPAGVAPSVRPSFSPEVPAGVESTVAVRRPGRSGGPPGESPPPAPVARPPAPALPVQGASRQGVSSTLASFQPAYPTPDRVPIAHQGLEMPLPGIQQSSQGANGAPEGEVTRVAPAASPSVPVAPAIWQIAPTKVPGEQPLASSRPVAPTPGALQTEGSRGGRTVVTPEITVGEATRARVPASPASASSTYPSGDGYSSHTDPFKGLGLGPIPGGSAQGSGADGSARAFSATGAAPLDPTPQAPPGALLEDVAVPSALTQQVRALRWQLEQLLHSLRPHLTLKGIKALIQQQRNARAQQKRLEPPAPRRDAAAPASSPAAKGAPRRNAETRQTAKSMVMVDQLEVNEYGMRKPFVLEEALKSQGTVATWSMPKFLLALALFFGPVLVMYKYGDEVMQWWGSGSEGLVPLVTGRAMSEGPIEPPGTANPELMRQVAELAQRQQLLPPVPTSRAGKTLQFLRPVLHTLGEDVTFVERELVMDVRKEVAETVRRKDYLIQYRNMQRYRPQVVSALEQAHLPETFSFIPWAISGYSPEFRFPEDERLGLWGLTPEVATRHGLAVSQGAPKPATTKAARDKNAVVRQSDERLDPRRATDAAISYLVELVGEVRSQSFSLALVAYPFGGREARRLLTHKPGWRMEELTLVHFLRENYLPSRMREFLVKVLAGAVIAGSPEQYDLPEEEE